MGSNLLSIPTWGFGGVGAKRRQAPMAAGRGFAPARIAKKRASPFGEARSANDLVAYRPYSVRPKVSDRKTPIWSRVTGLFGQ